MAVPIICFVRKSYDSNVNLAYLYDRYDVPCHFRLNDFIDLDAWCVPIQAM